MTRAADGRFVSYFGDLHPSYFGNVVKALGSTKQGYPGGLARARAAARRRATSDDATFFARLDRELRARPCTRCRRLTPTIVELIVKAPAAARRFRPGPVLPAAELRGARAVADGTRLQMEGLALTGAWVDPRARPRVDDRAGDGRLVEPVRDARAGRAGRADGTDRHCRRTSRATRPRSWSAAGLGNAVLFSIGQALRAAGSRVLYFAGYKKEIDRYKVADIEAAADVIVWCCDEEPGFEPERPQDLAFVGNIVQAMEAYASGRLGAPPIPLSRGRPHHRHRLRPDDGGGGAGAPRRARAATSIRITSPSARSTRRCSA